MTARHAAPPLLKIDIAVCTFRRRELEQTLMSLALMTPLQNAALRIIVADNDLDPSAAIRVDRARKLLPFDVVYVHCPAGNISIARNACLDASTADFLAFIDDDETADEAWLAQLIDTAVASGTAAILGPVKAHYRPDAPDWMRRGDFHSTRPVWVNGEIRTGYTCNVLLNLRDPAIAGRRFDLSLGRSGGEDTAFFAHVHERGGTIAFAPDAWVHEPVPLERASMPWLAKRRFRMGQTHGRVLAEKTVGLRKSVAVALAAGKCAVCLAGAVVLLASPVRRNRFVLRATLHAGTIAGLFGARGIVQYGRLEAQAR